MNQLMKKIQSCMKYHRGILCVAPVIVIFTSRKKVRRKIQMSLLEVHDLKVHLPNRGGIFNRVMGHVKVVDGVSFNIVEGIIYGLVGESGSGKSTTGRAIIGLEQVTEGKITFQ